MEIQNYGEDSGFKVAVHLQNIPDIQKLNYLTACLKGEALSAIRGYDITPENYDIIRSLLKNLGNHISLKSRSTVNYIPSRITENGK